MNRRALEITTPTHAMAVHAYIVASLIGLAFTVGVFDSPTLDTMLHTATRGWGLSILLCGLLSLSTCLRLSKWVPRRMRARTIRALWFMLRAEQLACAGLAFEFFLYFVALMIGGWPDLFALGIVKAFAGAYMIGGVARAWQIRKELLRLRAGLHDRHAADPPPLADPDR